MPHQRTLAAPLDDLAAFRTMARNMELRFRENQLEERADEHRQRQLEQPNEEENQIFEAEYARESAELDQEFAQARRDDSNEATRQRMQELADEFAKIWSWVRGTPPASSAGEEADTPDNRQDDSQTCGVCFANKRAVICLPCGHCVQCNSCWRKWTQRCLLSGRPPTCPQCRTPVAQTQHITQRQRDALSADADPAPRHTGSRVHGVPAGPIFMRAHMPVSPLASMQALLDGIPSPAHFSSSPI